MSSFLCLLSCLLFSIGSLFLFINNNFFNLLFFDRGSLYFVLCHRAFELFIVKSLLLFLAYLFDGSCFNFNFFLDFLFLFLLRTCAFKIINDLDRLFFNLDMLDNKVTVLVTFHGGWGRVNLFRCLRLYFGNNRGFFNSG